MSGQAEIIIEALQEILKAAQGPVGLHVPRFGGKEQAYVRDCLDSGWVSSVGQYVNKFEEQLAEFTGVKRAVAVVNGTAALHICLLLGGVAAGDEVLVPALSFVATVNAVAYCGAVPHFVDSEARTLGLDPGKLDEYLREIAEIRDGSCYNRRTGRRLAAVMPMHTFGHPVDLDALSEVAGRYRLTLVEDAAEALGSYYRGRHVGNRGLLSALSFNGNKVITTGGGGAILTNDERISRLAKHITTTAKVPHTWEFYHDMLGFNYRLPNINAALGCAQMEQLPTFLTQKRRLAEVYQQAFARIPGVRIFGEMAGCRSNYWLNALILDRDCANLRDELLTKLNAMNIQVRPVWNLLNTLPMYEHCPRGNLSTAEDLAGRIINLPSSAHLAG